MDQEVIVHFTISYLISYSFICNALFYVSVLQTPDAMTKIFPIITTCTYQRYSPSGSMDRFYAMCILNQNFVNRYIYLALWFLYIALWVTFSVVIIYRYRNISSYVVFFFISLNKLNRIFLKGFFC